MRNLIAGEPFEAKEALLFYRTEGGLNLVQHHELLSTPDGSLIYGPGTQITENFIQELIHRYERRPLNFLPEQVLGVTERALIWYEPAGLRSMFFTGDDEERSELGRAGVPLPGLVFVVRNNQEMQVYALAEAGRPTPDTPLYHAPLLNLYGDHRVCLGSTALPDHLDPDRTEDYSQAYFRSAFTHGSPQFLGEGSYTELLQAAQAEGSFPAERLKPAGKSVGALFRS